MVQEFIKVIGFKSATVWMDRVVARLPETAGRDIIQAFGKKLVRKIRVYAGQDAIYHSEHPGMLGRSFAWHMQGKYVVIIDSSHPGAEAANYGMTTSKTGLQRVRFPGGKWRTIKRPGKIMTKSRALHFVEDAVVDTTKELDGIIEHSMKKRGFD